MTGPLRALLVASVALSLLLVAHVAPAAALTFGEPGSGDGQLALIDGSGVAVNEETQHVYVADTENHRVVEFDGSGAFVRAWGGGVGGPGVNVCTSGCVAGASEDSPGAFVQPRFIAVDNSGGASQGSVYVGDSGTKRVSKFGASGALDTSWGSGGQLDGSSSPNGPFVQINGITVTPAGELAVYADPLSFETRLFRFAADGTFLSDVRPSERGSQGLGLTVDGADNFFKVNGGEEVEKFTGAGVDVGQVNFDRSSGLAADRATGELFVGNGSSVSNFTFEPSGEVVGTGCTPAPFAGCPPTYTFGANVVSNSAGLAVDSVTGTVYVAERVGRVTSFIPDKLAAAETGDATGVTAQGATIDGTVNPRGNEVLTCSVEYGPTEALGESQPCAESPAEIGQGTEPVAVHADLTGLPSGTILYYRVAVTTVGGLARGADRTFRTLGPPTVAEERIVSVERARATARFEINPEGAETTYLVEYGPTTVYGSETAATVIPSGTGAVAASVLLPGLEPGVEYHWRVKASNAFGSLEGPDNAFTTLGGDSPEGGCANQAFRVGPSANLPDCRAYELVSPANRGGGDIKTMCNRFCLRTSLNQSSVTGNAITYSSYKAFANSVSAPFASQYIARRGDQGWSTEAITPPKGASIAGSGTSWYSYENAFKVFSPDLGTAWFNDENLVPLTADATPGAYNVYSRDNLTGALTALTKPELGLSGGGEIEGISGDGKHAVFAGTEFFGDLRNIGQLYLVGDGVTQIVSLRPDGSPDSGIPQLGSEPKGSGRSTFGRGASNVDNAISHDGSRVFWTSKDSNGPNGGGIGPLFVTIVGERTIEISSQPVTFRTATPDGSSVFYEEDSETGGPLYEFDVETESQRTIADSVVGILSASDDGRIIYFVSEEGLAPGSEVGQPNLYVEVNGEISLVTTLAWKDVETPGAAASGPSAVFEYPIGRTSRATPNGDRVAFQSVKPLTGYDNRDLVTGFRDMEVFVYDRISGDLTCVSCSPTGERPRGQAYPYPLTAGDERIPAFELSAAAWLPGSETSHHTSEALSENGKRLFFNSYVALVPGDSNNAQDVYQWEDEGEGSCTTPGGCVRLISSGESAAASEFVDADPTGANAFFETYSSLVASDRGNKDIYVARVGGGFTEADMRATPCQGEACQVNSPPPQSGRPASSVFTGPGNPSAKTRKSCPKGKHRKGGRCVKKRHQSKQAKKAKGRRGSAHGDRRNER